MANDAIVRFHAESSEYDQKLKKAIDQMQRMEQEVRRTGASFAVADKEELEFVRSLGQMQTQANSAKGQMREFTEAILTLTQQYRNLSEEERNGDHGRALAESIATLKGRAADLQDTIGDLNEELKHMSSDTSFSDGMSMMTRTVGSCAAAITAWTGDSREMEAVIKDLAKIGTTVAAVEQLTKAFQKQNLVMLKNPYVAAAAAVVALGLALTKIVKKTQELSAVQKALNDVEQKGRENSAQEVARIDTLNSILHDNTRSLQERKSALQEIQSLVPEYHGALTEEGNLINDNTGAIDDYIDGLQRAATAQAAFDKMVELQKQKMEQQVKMKDAQKNLDAAKSMQSAPMPAVANGGAGAISMQAAQGLSRASDTAAAQAEVNKIQKEIDEADQQIQALRDLVKANDITTTTNKPTKTTKGGTVKVEAEVELPEGSIAALQKKISELNEAWRMATTDEERAGLKKQIEDAQVELDKLIGKVEDLPPAEMPITFSHNGLSAIRSKIMEELSSVEIGTGGYAIAADKLVDFTTFENLLKAATENGLDIDTSRLESFFGDVKLGVDIPDDQWESLVEEINAQLAELDLPPIELDVKTGGVKKLNKEVAGTIDHVSGAAAAFQALGDAMSNIDDPGAQVAGLIAQAIGSVVAGYGTATAQAATMGPWAWIAFALTGLATMISMVAGIKQATAGSYANGGVVPGSSFSGDNTIIAANAGEVVLNHAQQANLASQLEGDNLRNNLHLSTDVSGTNLRIVLDNDNRSKGGSRGAYSRIK